MALLSAAEKGNLLELERLLQAPGVKVNAQEGGSNVLRSFQILARTLRRIYLRWLWLRQLGILAVWHSCLLHVPGSCARRGCVRCRP